MPRAAAAGGGGSVTRASTRATAAEAPLPPCPVLARFQAAWDELAPTLPAAARVRMEGVDPACLSGRRAAALALRYPVKWATTTYACPPEARAPCGWDAARDAASALGWRVVHVAWHASNSLQLFGTAPLTHNAHTVACRWWRTLRCTRRRCARCRMAPRQPRPACASAWRATACGSATRGPTSCRRARALRSRPATRWWPTWRRRFTHTRRATRSGSPRRALCCLHLCCSCFCVCC